MALSNLEKALIERLQEPRLDGGLTAAANIVHEITRIQAPDDETPADYIRRAVQEVKSDPSMGLELAVEAYKHYSGFQFNAQSGKPTDYLIEMAKRHKQLFESPQAVDTQAGIQQAAILISSRAAMPFFPNESHGNFLARVADNLHGNYARGVADIVNKLMDVSGISFIGTESSGEYITRVGEIAKNARKPNSRDTATRLHDVSGIPFLDDKESYDAYITRVGEMAKSYKQLSETAQAVDIRPGMEQAAMLVSSRAGMPLLPTETNEAYLVRVADQLNYALTMAKRVNNCDVELIDMIADRAGVYKRTDGQTDVDFVKLCLDEIDNNGYAAALEHICEHTEIPYGDNAQVIVANIIDTINKNKKPE